MKGAVKVKVKHPGILGVPEGKKVWSLKKSDIISLCKKKSKAAISKAVQNLIRWNRNKRSPGANKTRAWANKAAGWVHAFEAKVSWISYVRAKVSKSLLK